MKIIKADAEYTGGGIYRYTAETDNGTFLLGDSEWDAIYELSTDPNETENSWYNEWIESHTLNEITGKAYYQTIKKLFTWILVNSPEGNYSRDDIERNLKEETEQGERLFNPYCSRDGWRKTPKTVETWTRGNYNIEIVTTFDTFEAWLYGRDMCIKEMMFGCPQHQQSKEDFMSLVEANIEDYIADYEEEYAD